MKQEKVSETEAVRAHRESQEGTIWAVAVQWGLPAKRERQVEPEHFAGVVARARACPSLGLSFPNRFSTGI